MQSESLESQENRDGEQIDQKWRTLLNDDKKGICKIDRVCCIKIRGTWSMKKQIAIASIILFLSTFAILIAVTSYNILKISEIFENSQNQLYISQAQKNLQIIGIKFQRLIKIQFTAVQKDILIFEKIYLSVSRNPNLQASNFLNTPYLQKNLTFFQSQFYYSWLCYSAYNNSTNQSQIGVNDPFSVQSIKHYNQIYPLIINQNYTYLSSAQFTAFKSQEQLIYLYPCEQLPSSYRPQERDWYINMQNIDQSYRNQSKININFYMSQPYFHYGTQMTQISMTKSLLNKNYKFEGVQGSAIDISRFSQLFHVTFTSFTALLVNYDGSLLISPYFTDSDNGNQTITGFDLNDWQQVTNMALNKQIEHNCSLSFLNSESKLLCRWNKITQNSQLIYAFHLRVYNYFIVILLDENQVLQQLYVQRKLIEESLVQVNIIYFCSMSIIFFFLLALVLSIITIIFKPLNNITAYCHQINQKNLMKHENKKNKLVSIHNIVTQGVFHLFTLSFRKLVKKFISLKVLKNRACSTIEKQEYPKLSKQTGLHVDDQVIFLENKNEIIDSTIKWSQETQINHTDKYQLKQISSSPTQVNEIYNRRLLSHKYSKQVNQIKEQFHINKFYNKERLVKLIFLFYKKQ